MRSLIVITLLAIFTVMAVPIVLTHLVSPQLDRRAMCKAGACP